MKLMSFGELAIGLLFALNSFGQQYSREQLKNLEVAASAIKKDTAIINLEQLKSESDFDLIANKAFQNLDAVVAFVTDEKRDKTNTFAEKVIPFLDAKCNELNLKELSFNEDEKAIYDSFLQFLEWDKTIETVKLYERFVLENKIERTESLLTVFSFIKCTYFFLKRYDKQHLKLTGYECLAENFKGSNEVDWDVFSFNPGRLVFWTIAACAWEAKSEK